ncbi:MAG: hypothetical protein JRJ78_06475 [Deltaproteobacteria bacterium]|nr:hypothetical protein [Deltaproteobacteria bacterium]
MDYIDWLLIMVDDFLIGPYRWFHHPLLGWWAGTFILALWASILGELTLAVAYRVNRSAVNERLEETSLYHQRSLNALKSGDKKSYKAINRLANEAFGKSFFLMMAMGMSSLWPAFMAAAWLQKRFGDIRFPFPFVENGLNFVSYFIVCYIMTRILVGAARRKLKKRTACSGGRNSIG